MIVTHGGLEGGYGLYLRDGKPTFVYNFLSIDRPTFAAKDPLAERQDEARRRLRLRRRRHGQGRKDHHDRQRQRKSPKAGWSERSPSSSRLGEGLDVGRDVGSPIDFTYELPFAFTGKIDNVTIELKAGAQRKVAATP